MRYLLPLLLCATALPAAGGNKTLNTFAGKYTLSDGSGAFSISATGRVRGSDASADYRGQVYLDGYMTMTVYSSYWGAYQVSGHAAFGADGNLYLWGSNGYYLALYLVLVPA